ncbi:hypothetical protein [Arthrobacter sp. MA-N2]|uniref:hypothetical protein n=1 Tax=Arthrobacter sp. MA-N2 TaxID=1101188 RepID=UPI0004B4DDDF|nr:hypothetical protein [Arthrobacter sp. MA-N2]
MGLASGIAAFSAVRLAAWPEGPGAKPHARMLRLSIGLEDSADIVDDLVCAIESTR